MTAISAAPFESRLHRDDIEAIARRVSELLHGEARTSDPSDLLTAAQVAKRFGVERGWVYDHARELEAVRLGDGPRPRLRFDVERVAEALTARQQSGESQRRETPVSTPSRRRSRQLPTAAGARLLPIRGDGA